MKLRSLSLLLVFFFIIFAGNCQLTDTFKSIDAKNSFKDVEFGSSYLEVNKKMNLIKLENSKNLPRYNFTEKKYLSIGIYKVTNAFVEFNDNKLAMIFLEIPNNYKEVIEYLTSIFGTPEFKTMWIWKGHNLTYSLGGDSNSLNAMIIISSNKINLDAGKSNF